MSEILHKIHNKKIKRMGISNTEIYPDKYSSCGEWIKELRIKWQSKPKANSFTISKIPSCIFIDHFIVHFLNDKYYTKDKISCIPGEEFISNQLPIFPLIEICRCIQVSREWRDYFNTIEFWKFIYVSLRVILFSNKRLHKLKDTPDKKVEPCMRRVRVGVSGVRYECMEDKKCNLLIINETKDISYDIFYCNKLNYDTNNVSYYDSLKAGDTMKCITYANVKWICIPSRRWIRETTVSSVGFSWIIDVNKYQYKENPEKNKEYYPKFVKRILQPDLTKTTAKIKGIDRPHTDYKGYKQDICKMVSSKKIIKSISKQIYQDRNAEIRQRKILMQKLEEVDDRITAIDNKKDCINHLSSYL